MSKSALTGNRHDRVTPRLIRLARRGAAVVGGALVLTLASGFAEDSRLEVQDWDCPPAPASCARPVVVAGVPVPYVSDYHGLSPVGSADVVGAVLGLDHFHAGAFWANVAFYGLVLAGLQAAWSRFGPRNGARTARRPRNARGERRYGEP
jgi:hypothetical protein